MQGIHLLKRLQREYNNFIWCNLFNHGVEQTKKISTSGESVIEESFLIEKGECKDQLKFAMSDFAEGIRNFKL